MIRPDQFRFFLDSGAFSAWSQGAKIDLDEYCAFIRANADGIHTYASLDTIPGQRRCAPTEEDKRRAVESTWGNYLYMKAEGLDPLPVYHYGEPSAALDRMLQYGCRHLGLGGLVGTSTEVRVRWLDRVFAKLGREAPGVQVHGFGMTNVDLIFRYPWHSVDSTTWLRMALNGIVLLPVQSAGRFIFTRYPKMVSPSNRTNPTSTIHLTRLSRQLIDSLQEWLAECGMTLEQVAGDSAARRVCNGLFFKRVSEVRAEESAMPARGPVRTTNLWEDL